jgi:twitching motility protein PilT
MSGAGTAGASGAAPRPGAGGSDLAALGGAALKTGGDLGAGGAAPGTGRARLEAATLSMRQLFEFAAEVRASDVLVTAGSPPVVRIDGDLQSLAVESLAPKDTKRLVWSLLNETQQEAFERQKELDFSLAVTGDLRFRANVYYQKGAVAAAFRLIPRQAPNMETLGLPPILQDLTLKPHGLILITGSTGSGKSTTMASMIDLINRSRRCHIVTVEDPIEFVHQSKHAVIDQREVFADTLSFKNALKYVLRQDPDVILIGEMRDMETIQAALTAAETGHLVIATLHTNDAVQSIDRIIDVFPPHQHDQIRVQLAFALLAVVSQQLVPRKQGGGRVLAAEVLIKSYAVATHIREGKTHMTRTVMESSRREGMVTMDHRLKELYEAGTISYQELTTRISSAAALKDVELIAAAKEAAPAAAQRKRRAP